MSRHLRGPAADWDLAMDMQDVASAEPVDGVTRILESWSRECPDVDVSGEAVVGRIARLSRLVNARLKRVVAAHGLEPWEFDVLATLRRAGDPWALTAGQCIQDMMVSSGTMTHRIDRLEQRGLVERRRNPDDGRQVLVGLTGAGRTLVDAALLDHAATEVQLLGALDAAQREELAHLLCLLGASLEAGCD